VEEPPRGDINLLTRRGRKGQTEKGVSTGKKRDFQALHYETKMSNTNIGGDRRLTKKKTTAKKKRLVIRHMKN